MKFSDKFGGYKVCLDISKVEEAIERLFSVYCKMSMALQCGDKASYKVFEQQYNDMELMLVLMGFHFNSEGYEMDDDGSFDAYTVDVYAGPYNNDRYSLSVRFEPLPLSYTGTYAQYYTAHSEWAVYNNARDGIRGFRTRNWVVLAHWYRPPHTTYAEQDERREQRHIKYTCGHEEDTETYGTRVDRDLTYMRLRQCKCPACTEADENRLIAEHEAEADKNNLPKFVGKHWTVVNAYKRRDEFIKLMSNYTLDSDWRQPFLEWDGAQLTKEEIYTRIIRGVTDPEWWDHWVYMGGGMPDNVRAYEEALDQYDMLYGSRSD